VSLEKAGIVLGLEVEVMIVHHAAITPCTVHECMVCNLW